MLCVQIQSEFRARTVGISKHQTQCCPKSLLSNFSGPPLQSAEPRASDKSVERMQYADCYEQ